MTNPIDAFLSELNRAEVNFLKKEHREPDLEGYLASIVATDVNFNGFTNGEYLNHSKHLQRLYDKFCTNLDEEISKMLNKEEKLTWLTRIQLKLKEIDNAVIIKDGNLTHSNLTSSDYDPWGEEWGPFIEVQRAVSSYLENTKRYVSNATSRINGLVGLLNPSDDKSSPTQEKLNVNLSVSQLSTLYRILKEAEILDSKTKAEIIRFIPMVFEGKRVKNISPKSTSKHFISPEAESLDFWIECFEKLKEETRKLKEKFSR